MQTMSIRSDSTSCSPEPVSKRFSDVRKRLSIGIKSILDQTKKQAQQLTKQNNDKPKVYTNLNQVQCMKDVKSQNGFYHQYQVGKKLGQGCHSTVYKCTHRGQKKHFAVKMTKQKDLELFQSIRQGYRILKKLEHQSIIQAKNLYINEKYMTCFMVIQYCEYQDLKHYMRSHKSIERQETAAILTQLLKALNYMHNSGVCHRDIKPDNILYDHTKKKIKIIDFDLSRIKKFTHGQLEMMTKTGCVAYRAPQIFKSIYNEKVDTWAVGVIAYQLLKRQRPFHSEYEEDQIHKICEQEPNYDELSVWQQDLIQKLLCKDPTKRATPIEALSSPFFLVNSKLVESPPSIGKTMVKSPSAGKQQFQRMRKKSFASKFYDDDVTNMFLGGNEGDIGVIRCNQQGNSSNSEDNS